MKLLALDTATEVCSVALQAGADAEVYKEDKLAPREHAALLLPMVKTVLSRAGLEIAELDGIVYGRGPGSFTGVRIALAAAQALALVADCELVGVSSLQAMALQSMRLTNTREVLAAIDARMQQIYAGWYCQNEAGVPELLGREHVLAATELAMPQGYEDRSWLVAGSAVPVYTAAFRALRLQCLEQPVVYPSAADMLVVARPLFEQGMATPPEQAMPVYLRDKVAQTEAERQEKQH